MDNVSTQPLLTYACSISVQTTDKDGKAKSFSIFAGDIGSFSTNVLKHMPPSKYAGKYLMTFDPEKPEIIIRPLSNMKEEQS